MDKAQKNSYVYFEVECRCVLHDVHVVSENSLVEVVYQTMVALSMPGDWLYVRSLAEQFSQELFDQPAYNHTHPTVCIGDLLPTVSLDQKVLDEFQILDFVLIIIGMF
ncbi:MAG: hypothetical protein HUJ98_00070 [Bacteroidaceae bacterium]|nr:hypothetical protein [Bacteroidaceae bacterium]